MENRVQLINNDANGLAIILLNLPFAGVGGMFAAELSELPEISKTMSLAIDLCTNVKTIKQVKEDLLTGKVSAHQALSGIIKDWIKKNKKSARLDRLISAVSSNGLNFDYLISSEFHCPIPKEGGQQVEGGEVAGSSAVSLVPGNTFNSKRLRTRKGNGCSSSAGDDNCGGVGAKEKSLVNLVIIREIFKNLDDRSQMSFLHVCRAWRNECLGLWRRYVIGKLLKSKHGVQVIDIITPEKTICFSEEMVSESRGLPCLREYYKAFVEQKDLALVESKHSLVKQPFRRLSISSPVYAWQSSAGSPLTQFFWKVLSPHVTYLELDGCSIVNGPEIEAMRWLLLKRCPQLEVLRMTRCRELNSPKNIAIERKACTSLAVGDAAKNLHTMHLDSDYSCAFRQLDIIPNLKEITVSKSGTLDFSKFYKLPGNKSPLPITKLDFEFNNIHLLCNRNYDDFGFLQYCKAAPYNIKELTVRLIIFKDSPAHFVSIFFSGIAHCKELRKLDIRYRKTDHPGLGFLTPFRAMKLPKLTTFCVEGRYYGEPIEGYMNSKSRNATFDLKTIAGMPNLEYLNIDVHFHHGKIEKWIAMEAEPAHQIRFEGMQNVDSNVGTGFVNLKSLYFNNRYENGNCKPSQAEVEEICQWGVNLERINGFPVGELLSVHDGSGDS